MPDSISTNRINYPIFDDILKEYNKRLSTKKEDLGSSCRGIKDL